MSSKDEEDSVIKWLVELGILKDLGYNEIVGDNIYYIDSVADEIMPAIKEEHQRNINQSIFDLWEIDMLDVTFNDDGEPLIALNQNSLNAEKIGAMKDEDLKRQLLMIIAIFDEKFNEDK